MSVIPTIKSIINDKSEDRNGSHLKLKAYALKVAAFIATLRSR